MACLAAAAYAQAQGDKETFEKSILRSVLGDGEDSFLTFTSENDLYCGGTDKNYTNGARVTWFDLGAEPPLLAGLLDSIVPAFRVNDTTSTYYSLGQNIFLDGNTFRDSPSVDKEYFVADASAGAAMTFGPTRISYTLNWRSREFEGQDDPSIFGAVAVGFRLWEAAGQCRMNRESASSP